jgi:hypothetical protein
MPVSSKISMIISFGYISVNLPPALRSRL